MAMTMTTITITMTMKTTTAMTITMFPLNLCLLVISLFCQLTRNGLVQPGYRQQQCDYRKQTYAAEYIYIYIYTWTHECMWRHVQLPFCFTLLSFPYIRLFMQRPTHISSPLYMSHSVSHSSPVDSSPAWGADAADQSGTHESSATDSYPLHTVAS